MKSILSSKEEFGFSKFSACQQVKPLPSSAIVQASIKPAFIIFEYVGVPVTSAFELKSPTNTTAKFVLLVHLLIHLLVIPE